MLRIQKAQLRLLAAEQDAEFQRELAAHLRRFFPERTEVMTAEQLEVEIRYGIARAQHHRFHKRAEIARYLNLMFELGRDFDLYPDCPWAARVLATDIPHRMEYLFDWAAEALRKQTYVTR
ncbi:MAG TPA: hypothetical protein VEU33_51780 [Archangium sp.]|nr:hypothetical protein [Archangium sp.]